MIYLLGVNGNRDHSLSSERIYKLKVGLPTHLFFLVIIHCSIFPPKSSSNAFRIMAQERKDPWADLEDSTGSLIWFSQPASLNLLFLILKQELNSLNWCGNYLGDLAETSLMKKSIIKLIAYFSAGAWAKVGGKWYTGQTIATASWQQNGLQTSIHVSTAQTVYVH